MNSDAKHIIVFTLGRDRESSFQWIDDGTYRRDKDMAFNQSPKLCDAASASQGRRAHTLPSSLEMSGGSHKEQHRDRQQKVHARSQERLTS